jgi:type III secretory pathway component EscV
MAGHSESNDGGDLFWPGYVDAVTNLAINLLFVIAVMSIVVIGITLQIAQMTKKKAIEEAQSQQTASSASSTQEKQKGEAAKDANASTKDPVVSQLQQTISEYQKKLEQTQKQLQDAQAKLSSSDSVPIQTVQASQNKPTEPKQPNKVQAMSQPAVMIVFSPDVVTMAPSEVADLMAKLKKISPLNTGRWEISVISPKGFSEAVRLAFYRANAARNALLENGVASQAIDIKINESAQAGADNSKVLVKWLP